MFNIVVLGIASLLTDVSTEMVYPLLPLYLVARLGASYAVVGMIEGLAESVASLLRVFSGLWSDRVQQRKPLAIAGYALSLVGKYYLFISTTWPIVLVGRLFDRFGKGIRTAPRDALIADSSDPATRGSAFGLHRALDSAGASIGVLLAFVFFVSFHDDFTQIFLISLAPAALGIAVLFLVRERRPVERAARAAGTSEPWWRNLGARWGALDRRLKLFLVVVLIFALGNSSNEFLLLRASNLGFDDATVILLYLVYNLVYAAISWPAGRLSDRVGRKRLLVAGYFTYGIVYLAFAVASPGLLWGLFPAYGIYVAFTDGVEKALVSELAPLELRATLIGLHATFVGVGLLPASVLAGVLWNVWGPSAPFLFGGGMGLLAAVALWRLI